MPKFVGPFQIVRKLCATTYQVETLPAQRNKRKKRQFNAHVCQMRQFHAQRELDWTPENWQDLTSEEDAGDQLPKKMRVKQFPKKKRIHLLLFEALQ